MNILGLHFHFHSSQAAALDIPQHLGHGRPGPYIFKPHVAGEEGMQAHIPVLAAPQDSMAALRDAHVAAPGLLQFGLGSCAFTH